MILAPELRKRYQDSDGNPLAGGKLYSYVAGTTTPLETYTDRSGSTPNTNPVILDADGYADVWIDPSLAYKFILKDANDAQIFSVDGVTDPNSSEIPEWNANATYSEGSIVRDSSGEGLLYVSLSDSNSGNLLTSTGHWRMFDGNVRTITSSGSAAVTDNLVESNSTSGSVTVTLPACSTTPIGKRITVKDIGSGSNTTSVRGAGSDQVDGAVTYATALRSTESVTVMNNGTSWRVVDAYHTKDGSIIGAKLAAGAVSATDKLADGIVTPIKRSALGQQVSSSSGAFSTTSNSYVDVTNLSVSITTTGRPVVIACISDGTDETDTGAWIIGSTSTESRVAILRSGTGIAYFSVTSGGSSEGNPVTLIQTIDPVAAGTYTYKIQLKSSGGTTISFRRAKLIAYEL